MVQEISTCSLCINGIKDDHCGSSKIDSSRVTQCSPSIMEGINAISSVDQDEDKLEEEWKRRKRDELIQYYIQRHEDFFKNSNVCLDAIKDVDYYLISRRKRSKRKSSYKVDQSFLKRENKRLKMIRKEKSMEKSLIKEEGISNVESFLKNVRGDLKSIKKSLITTKIESFLKSEKRKKVVHNKKPKRVSQAILPMEFRSKIQELGVSISEVSLVIEKPLFTTDLNKKHMRLSIPVNQVLNHEKFLTIQEKEILNTKDSSERWSQIKFNLIEPSLELRSIHLAKWPMNSSFSYVLLNDWMSVYKRNNLKVNMMVQLWYFRKDSDRWLALVVVPPAPEASDDMMQIKSELT